MCFFTHRFRILCLSLSLNCCTMLGRLVLAGCCSVVWCFTPPALAPRRLVVRSESLEDSLTADVLAPLRNRHQRASEGNKTSTRTRIASEMSAL